MKKQITTLFSLAIIIIISAYTPYSNAPKADINGYWVREKDGLQMELYTEDYDETRQISEIIVEGSNFFPCPLERHIIYKNITHKRDSIWTCDFLVISPDDCSVNYRTEGQILLTDIGKLLVMCPGFQPMYYDRKNPRH